ncbi:hypothetical protein [Aneurinibacillus tyrosinisolvens]|uniref:hypothetical protein n=1 Tax=Aneurinibacillus tyrosinisolvens TaxID=1443435 RepID=UPI00063F520C|nr:hypothetical protein [Aneurinibacillus tyrosinisolvens]
MNQHLYIHIRDLKHSQVISLLEERGISKRAELVLLSEVVLVPKKMETIQEKLTSPFPCSSILVIQDDLTCGGIKDLERLFGIYFSPEQQKCFADPFLFALKTHTVRVSPERKAEPIVV